MKKISLLLAALLGLGTAAQAQHRGGGSNVSLGLKAGASYTSFVGPDNGGAEYRFGFHGGVFANIGFTKLFAFQPELIYSQKGANVANINDTGVRLHYIDVPLAFHVNTNGLFLEAGPQVGFLLSAKYHDTSITTDLTDSFNSVDFGYLFGVGYQLKHGLGVGLRYNGGFTNIPKSYSLGTATVQTRQRNSAFQLYLTYSVNGKR